MSSRLPPHAHLDHLKKQAKDLLRAHRSGEPAAMRRLRAYLTRLSDDEATSSSVSLQEAQYVIAREYGFSNWAGLLEEVQSKQDSILQVVRNVHGRLLPALHTLFAEALGREVQVEIVEARHVTSSVYVESLGPSCWNYRFHINHEEGWAHLAFSLPLCGALLKPEGFEEGLQRVEAIVGTQIDETDEYNDDFHVIARFVIALAPEIEKAWQTVFQMGMGDFNLQTAPSSLQSHRPTDPAIHIKFEVKSEGCENQTLSLCYPLSTLEPVLSDLGSKA